jgi:2-amino-4-hydroxy-6-hydroxymethyldihydropteridine diphosphokinase
MHYFLSIGSNLNPEKNIILILEQLFNFSAHLLVSKIILTPAEGFISNNHFLNTCIYFKSDFDPIELKKHFNRIETQLGRDRNAPDRAKQDHPADIDIIWKLETLNRLPALPTEPYIQPLLLELLSFLGYPIETSALEAGVSLEIIQQQIGLNTVWITKEKI